MFKLGACGLRLFMLYRDLIALLGCVYPSILMESTFLSEALLVCLFAGLSPRLLMPLETFSSSIAFPGSG